MPRFIIKMEKDGDERFLEWSTVVDSPVTYGMTYDEFLEFYQREYGISRMDDLLGERGRMARVWKHGTSERGADSVHDTITPNRAGENETELDYDGIWQTYVLDRPEDDDDEPEDPIGDFYRLCAMLTRAGVEFREVLRSGERILDVSMGSTVVRFVCDADGCLKSIERPRAPSDPL